MRYCNELEKISWREVEAILRKYRTVVALIPIGSTEQHGPHLPLGTDFIIANEICRKFMEYICSSNEVSDLALLKLPPIPYGYSVMWLSYPGTITLNMGTLLRLIEDVISSLMKHNILNILIINAHAGNDEIIKAGIREVLEALGKGKVLYVNIWELVGDVINEVFTTKFFHADEVETSLALALGIELRCKPMPSPKPFRHYNDFWHSLDLTKRPKVHTYVPESRETHNIGSYGRPDLASIEKGVKLLNAIIRRLTDIVKQFIITQ